MNSTKGSDAAPNAARRASAPHGLVLTSGHAAMTAGKIASGTRFGLIAMASPAAMPEPAASTSARADAVRGSAARQARRTDKVQHVAVGTSLMGQSDMKITVGLLAMHSAAAAPTARPDMCTPIAYVTSTSSAAQIGPTAYGPHAPTIA